GRPLPASRLMARTVMSFSHRIWQLSRTPVRPRAARTFFSASVICAGSPAMNSTRQVVQRALPPQACSWSTFASSSSASTSRLPCGTSNSPTPSTVSFGMGVLLCLPLPSPPHQGRGAGGERWDSFLLRAPHPTCPGLVRPTRWGVRAYGNAFPPGGRKESAPHPRPLSRDTGKTGENRGPHHPIAHPCRVAIIGPLSTRTETEPCPTLLPHRPTS